MVEVFRQLVDGIRNWRSLTPKKKWELVYNLSKYAGYMFGLRLFGNNKLNWFTSMALVVFVVYVLLAAYTIVSHAMSGHFLEGASCLAISGIYISVSFITVY